MNTLSGPVAVLVANIGQRSGHSLADMVLHLALLSRPVATSFPLQSVIVTVAAGTYQFRNSALHRRPIEDDPKRNHLDLLRRGKAALM